MVTWLVPAARRERVREAVQRLLAKRPEVRRAILFGSLAKGVGTPASDADPLLDEIEAKGVVLASDDRPRWKPHVPAALQRPHGEG